MTSSTTRTDIASMIDHTLLGPLTTPEQIVNLVHEAASLGVYAVCVAPSYVPLARATLVELGASQRLVAVAGFPTGAHTAMVKATEAARACLDGADEVDVVINLGLALGQQWGLVERELLAVREATLGASGQVLLKVIVESAALDPRDVLTACEVAVAAGADFVKTSTGMHPAGGASVQSVRLMASAVAGRAQVKASGGISSLAQALAMIEAGATRLGTSNPQAILLGQTPVAGAY
jgi:deoxyribose-phosphate aldolase